MSIQVQKISIFPKCSLKYHRDDFFSSLFKKRTELRMLRQMNFYQKKKKKVQIVCVCFVQVCVTLMGIFTLWKTKNLFCQTNKRGICAKQKTNCSCVPLNISNTSTQVTVEERLYPLLWTSAHKTLNIQMSRLACIPKLTEELKTQSNFKSFLSQN